MRKVFSVLINNKPYDVYDIPNKEHSGLNDTIKTWWVYYASRLPDGVMPAIDSDSWEPYSVGIKRLLWDLSFVQRNTSKVKWDEYQFSNHISCTIKCNGKDVYEFGTYDMAFAIAKAQYLMVVMCEHPYNFLEPEEEKGRKIYYYGLPATIRPSSHPGEIIILPDYTSISKQAWWKEYKRRKTPMDKEFAEIEAENDSESIRNDSINHGDALSDGKIGWFRKDDDVKNV